MQQRTNILSVRRFTITPAVLLLSFVFLVSCKKFLDEPQKSGFALITTINDCQKILNGDNSFTQGPADGLRSIDDYYLTTADYNGLSEQLKRDFYVWAPAAQRIVNSGDWLNTYGIIYRANVAMESLDRLANDNPGLHLETRDDYKLVRGMALFLRSKYFYELAIIFSKPYTTATAGQDLGIPLRITSDMNFKSERGTVEEVYNRVTTDLQEAINLLPNATAVVTQPNKAAAYAMLARVYLAMEKYTLAGAATNSALLLKSDLLDYNSISQSSSAPFTRFNKEVFYHATFNSIETNSKLNMDSVLIASYNDSNDLRKRIFFQEKSPGTGVYNFKGNYSGDNSTFNGIATDEVYLIRAECYARAGNTAAAMADLNTLLRTRWKTGTYVDKTAANADAALAIILTERRKELVMRNQRWADLKRLNKDSRFAVTLKRVIQSVTYTLPPNDLRYQLLIPQLVIEYGVVQQNPR